MSITAPKLFRLIKTMKKEEKRFFKVFVSNNGRSSDKYLAIFDCLDKQEDFDREKYKKKVKHIKRLSSCQTYLYQVILKSLQNMHRQKDTEMIIIEGLAQAKLLFERQLLEMARDKILELIELAEKHSMIFYLPNLYQWYFRVNFMLLGHTQWEREDFERSCKKWKHSVKDLGTFVKIRSTYLSYNLSDYRFALHTNTKQFHLADEVAHLVNEQSSDFTQISFFQLMCTEASLKRDYKLVLEKNLEFVRFFQHSPKAIQEEFKLYYLLAVSNALSNVKYHSVSLFKELKQLLDKFNLEEFPKDFHLNKILFNYTELLLDKKFEAAKLMIPQLNKIKAKLPIPIYGYTHFIIALNHFIERDFDQTLTYTEWIIEYVPKTQALHMATVLFRIIVFYEKDELMLVPYLTKSASRVLNNFFVAHEFEQLIIQSINALVQKPENERGIIFKSFREKILAFINNQDANKLEFLCFFNFLAWVDSKINYTKFDTIFFPLLELTSERTVT